MGSKQLYLKMWIQFQNLTMNSRVSLIEVKTIIKKLDRNKHKLKIYIKKQNRFQPNEIEPYLTSFV